MINNKGNLNKMKKYLVTYKHKGKVCNIEVQADNAMLASDKVLQDVHKRVKIIEINRK